MDDFDKIAVIGRGAFGTVYLCRQGDGNRVVLKQIVIGHLNGNDLKNTEEEVKIMSTLNHPNVIKYYSSFFEDDCLVIIMEYAAKGTLYDYLEEQNGKLLSQDKVLHFFGQLCLALQYLHGKRILHRDITTKNILLTGCYRHVVKLSDFGLSKMVTSKSQGSSLVGTPCYLSPELCQGRSYGIHSDIWALGCVLYNMCTLKQAFEAPTLAGLVLNILHGELAPIDVTQYNMGLMEILQVVLDRDPLNRPTTTGLIAHPLIAPIIYKIATNLGSMNKENLDWLNDSFESNCVCPLHKN